MRFHVLTLFPQMIEQGLSESITGRALKQNIISLNTVNIRDFAASLSAGIRAIFGVT